MPKSKGEARTHAGRVGSAAVGAAKAAAKQAAKSRETLDLFVPLARRLGVEEIERELDQLCVSYLGEERPDGPSLLDSLLEDERICLRRQRACWREHRGACASSV